MIRTYDTYLGNSVIGKVNVCKQGLYLQVQGEFERHGDSIYRLLGINGNDRLDFGICIPCGTRLVFKKSVPVKNITFDISYFQLVDHKEREMTDIISVKNDQPFPNIKDLVNAKWCVKGDAYGVQISNTKE